MPVTGRIQKYHANFYYAEVGGKVYECFLKGILKKEGIDVLVGDIVDLDNLDEVNETARVIGVLERKNELSRPKIANVDMAVVVQAIQQPGFDQTKLDRYVAHVELAGLEPVICISKTDLESGTGTLDAIRALYSEKLGYPVFFTSIHQKSPLEKLLDVLRGKLSVLAGLSGVGKSSLLNALNSELELHVEEVSEKTLHGQHTTRHVELIKVAEDVYVADTPGFSNLKFDYVLPRDVEAIYRDFNAYRGDCEFKDCLHMDEDGCAVQANMEEVDPNRYESYREMITEALSYKGEVRRSSQKEKYGYKTLDGKGKESEKRLRLKGKARDSSRRAQRQEVRSSLENVLVDDSDEPI